MRQTEQRSPLSRGRSKNTIGIGPRTCSSRLCYPLGPALSRLICVLPMLYMEPQPFPQTSGSTRSFFCYIYILSIISHCPQDRDPSAEEGSGPPHSSPPSGSQHARCPPQWAWPQPQRLRPSWPRKCQNHGSGPSRVCPPDLEHSSLVSCSSSLKALIPKAL